jgi:1-acyl-sn-glycerol-3-phosphate acyltransferase
MIRTLAAFLFAAASILFVLPFLILWTAISGDGNPMYNASMLACRIIDRITCIRVRVEGLENIPPGVCVFASNHCSNVDPLVYIPFIPRRVSILMKKEIFRIPILSFGMLQVKFLPVDRSNREAAAKSVETAIDIVKSGLSFVIFPEGTRSPDGRMRPFKKGALAIPIRTGVPVVPVSISGSLGLMRKGEWIIRPGEAVLRFGPPVDASQYTLERRAELAERVELLVAAGLPPEQQPIAVR